jgi:elongation factor P
MRTAQEFRNGNVLIMEGSPMVVLKSEYNKSGRNAAVVKFKLRNLLSGQNTETVVKAADKFEEVILETKSVTFSYVSGETYAFMDENFEMIELHKDELDETSLLFLEENMQITIKFYGQKPVSVELPNFVEADIDYTEPGARGDTSGKVLKPARLANGYELQVPLFVEIGTRIKIDTRTGEYVERVK